jgi:hypothetical protein
MMPVDVVPSAFQVVLLPLCEGILVGLAAGGLITLALKAAERFFRTGRSPTFQPAGDRAQPLVPAPAGNPFAARRSAAAGEGLLNLSGVEPPAAR